MVVQVNNLVFNFMLFKIFVSWTQFYESYWVHSSLQSILRIPAPYMATLAKSSRATCAIISQDETKSSHKLVEYIENVNRPANPGLLEMAQSKWFKPQRAVIIKTQAGNIFQLYVPFPFIWCNWPDHDINDVQYNS